MSIERNPEDAYDVDAEVKRVLGDIDQQKREYRNIYYYDAHGIQDCFKGGFIVAQQIKTLRRLVTEKENFEREPIRIFEPSSMAEYDQTRRGRKPNVEANQKAILDTFDQAVDAILDNISVKLNQKKDEFGDDENYYIQCMGFDTEFTKEMKNRVVDLQRAKTLDNITRLEYWLRFGEF